MRLVNWIKFIFPGPHPTTTPESSHTGSVPLYPTYIVSNLIKWWVKNDVMYLFAFLNYQWSWIFLVSFHLFWSVVHSPMWFLKYFSCWLIRTQDKLKPFKHEVEFSSKFFLCLILLVRFLLRFYAIEYRLLFITFNYISSILI